MRGGMLDYIDFKGKIVISKYDKDSSGMLYTGEKVGTWKNDFPEMDIAVDPIDGGETCYFWITKCPKRCYSNS